MPKIIDKIIERINQSAFQLFAEKGYYQVTMKMVAQEAGISVGTLYNYYSNKQDLFLNVFKQNLTQAHSVLNSMIEKGGNPHELIATLYNEVVRLREFYKEILKNKIDSEVVNYMKKYILALMRSLIYKAEGKKDLQISEKDKDRAIRLLLIAIHDFSREFPEDQVENIAFICKLAEKIK
ncbi:MAG: TetR/AcrR family transcriptional regulator [Atribacterota bacterium]|nr:TetR/AcrR family transcriptional regulator [Atribacterota bacterium]